MKDASQYLERRFFLKLLSQLTLKISAIKEYRGQLLRALPRHLRGKMDDELKGLERLTNRVATHMNPSKHAFVRAWIGGNRVLLNRAVFARSKRMNRSQMRPVFAQGRTKRMIDQLHFLRLNVDDFYRTVHSDARHKIYAIFQLLNRKYSYYLVTSVRQEKLNPASSLLPTMEAKQPIEEQTIKARKKKTGRSTLKEKPTTSAQSSQKPLMMVKKKEAATRSFATKQTRNKRMRNPIGNATENHPNAKKAPVQPVTPKMITTKTKQEKPTKKKVLFKNRTTLRPRERKEPREELMQDSYSAQEDLIEEIYLDSSDFDRESLYRETRKKQKRRYADQLTLK